MFIEGMLTDTISYATYSAVDDDGVLTYGSATEVKAKVRDIDEVISSGESQDGRYRAEIITLTEITKQDRIWLPGESNSDTDLAHVPQSIESLKSLNSGGTVYKVKL